MKEELLNITAPVFNIQSYSIHDGPGIRVTVFVKGCPLRCIWCANPESNLARPQLMTHGNKCSGCGACVDACPKNAIALVQCDGRTREKTDRSLCTGCMVCTGACYNAAREVSGKTAGVAEVLEKVMADKVFMDASGGGMTVSGGECLIHPEFTAALLCAARDKGLHTAVESCCFASRAVIDKVFKYVDLGLLDIKHMDSGKHLEYTGVPNEQILDNIRYIYHELGVKVSVRVPVIPGCNDSDENIAATARFVRDELGGDVAVHLLPYHRLGESKNESLGNKVNSSIEIPSDAHMQHLKTLVESFGLQAQIGG